MTYATKIDGAWVAVPPFQQVTIGEISASWETFTAWDDATRESFGAYTVPEPGDPPAGKVETGRTLGGTTRPKWIVTYAKAPPVPEPQPTYRTLMTPIRFKAQFSVQERLAIGVARAYSGSDATKSQAKAVLDILFGDLDDPRLMEVDVADSAVISGIDFCRSIGVLTADRAATIKLGVAA